ncbi:MAG: hypothetical protein GQ532_07230 [Methylomarinum sp.]|nr:hypothetical protein [Methylomarinum sp.]
MKKLKVLVVAVMVALSGSVLAVGTPDTTAESYIIKIATRSNGVYTIFTNTVFDNLDGCDLINRGAFDDASTGAKSMLATALTASLSGLKVTLGIEGCLDIGGASGKTAPMINNVKVFIPVPVQ